MRESALDELFAEFEADALVSFRPPGVADAQRRVRQRRWRRRGVLAGLTALLLGGPSGAFALAGTGDDPSPTPSPTITISPGPAGKPVERKVAPSGVDGTLRQLAFLDARTAWALFGTCGGNDSGAHCRSAVVRTTDGGVTWQKTNFPANARGQLQLFPLDDQALSVTTRTGWLVTPDGGEIFSEHRWESPPGLTQLAVSTRSGFLTRCPGRRGLTDTAPGKGCARKELAMVGVASVPAQPPVTLRADLDQELTEGGDGRLWLTVRERGETTVLVTADAATRLITGNGPASWQRLPSVSGSLDLLVSPDGRNVWLAGTEGRKPLWRLTGQRWEETPGLPDDTNSVAALDSGILFVTSTYGSVGFLVDGRYVDRPELRATKGGDPDATADVSVLRDGTIALTYGGRTVLGVGSGEQRTWIRYS